MFEADTSILSVWSDDFNLYPVAAVFVPIVPCLSVAFVAFIFFFQLKCPGGESLPSLTARLVQRGLAEYGSMAGLVGG